jgi:pimeloyl-ACP methyl ester carboxylesterase
VALGGGRTLTLDDVGDPAGAPVVFLHGTPDSRLARHPDDGLAAAAGVRLVALDRPGYGGSTPLAAGTWSPDWPGAWAADVATALDAIDVERCAVLAWSGGALGGLALAAHGSPAAERGREPAAGPLAGRVAALGIVAGLVPRQAYEDPEVRAAGEARLGTIDLADVMPPGGLGDEVAPMLAPWPCDEPLAAEHQASQRTPADALELASVPGGAEAMAAGLAEGVRLGLAGVAADVEAQARPLAVDLSRARCPARLWYGEADQVTPVAFGRWYAAHLPDARLAVVEGAGHYLALTRWSQLLAEMAALVEGT